MRTRTAVFGVVAALLLGSSAVTAQGISLNGACLDSPMVAAMLFQVAKQVAPPQIAPIMESYTVQGRCDSVTMTVTLTGLGTMPIVVNKIDTCVLRVRPMVMGQPLFDSLVNVCQVTTPVALSPARAPGVFGLTVARTAGGVAIAWGAPVEANVAIYRSNGSLVASAVVHGSNYLWQARSESAGQYLCVVRSGNARVATTFVW